ncbi:hypothetical protein PsorP6_011622 [Peronosclerospora sorghi]|uniref:Uncharacterized protein n=1 Tax=Peronosclerospora sorghi TaxID=230839 RepID=A0ACC0WKH5_9STRA|nr:hypothetical protein PsorP6_011622 [Peronosclerospora sorghi]
MYDTGLKRRRCQDSSSHDEDDDDEEGEDNKEEEENEEDIVEEEDLDDQAAGVQDDEAEKERAASELRHKTWSRIRPAKVTNKVWKYYKKYKDESMHKDKAICDLFNSEVNIGLKGTTTNLTQHLREITRNTLARNHKTIVESLASTEC